MFGNQPGFEQMSGPAADHTDGAISQIVDDQQLTVVRL
jgi:hypothetical protein